MQYDWAQRSLYRKWTFVAVMLSFEIASWEGQSGPIELKFMLVVHLLVCFTPVKTRSKNIFWSWRTMVPKWGSQGIPPMVRKIGKTAPKFPKIWFWKLYDPLKLSDRPQTFRTWTTHEVHRLRAFQRHPTSVTCIFTGFWTLPPPISRSSWAQLDVVGKGNMRFYLQNIT